MVMTKIVLDCPALCCPLAQRLEGGADAKDEQLGLDARVPFPCLGIPAPTATANCISAGWSPEPCHVGDKPFQRQPGDP